VPVAITGTTQMAKYATVLPTIATSSHSVGRRVGSPSWRTYLRTSTVVMIGG
jgi:hypothetical protein